MKQKQKRKRKASQNSYALQWLDASARIALVHGIVSLSVLVALLIGSTLT